MIFYFTGTGNSLYAARSLSQEIFSIPQEMKQKDHSYQADQIGIVCPIYGHEMPQMVKKFIAQSSFDTPYFFLILTYGNRHANAAELAEKHLEECDMHADYIASLLMVDNFLPVFNMAEQKKIDKCVEEQLAKIKADIDMKKHWIEPVTEKDRAAHVNYLKLVGSADAGIWASFRYIDACIGCGICTKVCPAGCIAVQSGRPVRNEKNCQACYACIQACPQKAIQLNPVLGFAEKNPQERYRNEHVSVAELIKANQQN